jgi:hypothetical protein
MSKRLLSAAVCALALAGASDAAAGPQICKNAAGRQIACPPPAAALLHQCRDIKTKKFAACGPGAEPAPLRHFPG